MLNELNDLKELYKQCEEEKDSAIYDAEYAEKRSEELEIALHIVEKAKRASGIEAFDADSAASGTAADARVSTMCSYLKYCIECATESLYDLIVAQ
eukprot:14966-Heterococcus_DN1.PRE.2